VVCCNCISVECSDDEQSTAVNAVKLLPSVGRGKKLPPICDISLPKAYYDELPSHVQMLSKSGLGRGQLLSDRVGENRALESTGERLFPTNVVPELPVSSVASDDFSGRRSANEEDTASHPAAEASRITLKSLADQFSTVK